MLDAALGLFSVAFLWLLGSAIYYLIKRDEFAGPM